MRTSIGLVILLVLATSSIVEAKRNFSQNTMTKRRRLGISPEEDDMVWRNVQKVPEFRDWNRGMLMSYNNPESSG